MDDGSRDGTARDRGGASPRATRGCACCRRPPLPPGWTGKVHACARLAEAARGTHLLFIDADVRLAPDAAARMAGHAAAHGPRPRHRRAAPAYRHAGRGADGAAINLLMLGYLPGAGRAVTAHPAMAAACGQLHPGGARGLSTPWAGTRPSATCCTTALALARNSARPGHRTEVVDGTPLATCRMYRGFARSLERLPQERAGGHGDAGRPAGLDALLLGGPHRCPGCCCPTRRRRPPCCSTYATRAADHAGARASRPGPSRCIPAAVAVALAIQWTALARAGRAARPRPARVEGPRLPDVDGAVSGEHGEAAPRASRRATPARRTSPSPRACWRPAARRKVLAFYRFVRAADDVADDPRLTPADKLAPARRDGSRAATAPTPPCPRPPALHAHGGRHRGGAAPCLPPFARMPCRRATRTGPALLDYCARSAAPVGRILLRLHGEDAGQRARPPTRSARRCRC